MEEQPFENQVMNRYVIDTNILLISIPKISAYRQIFDSLISGRFELAITNEILEEYSEIISEKANVTVSKNITDLLLSLPNVIKTDVYYKWNLIEDDKDNNKFVDAAISANADMIITNDRHFNILNTISFPKVKIIGVDDFLILL